MALTAMHPNPDAASPSIIFAKRNSTQSNVPSEQELVAVMYISLSAASISVLAALCAFYWFVRMRRSFRHE